MFEQVPIGFTKYANPKSNNPNQSILSIFRVKRTEISVAVRTSKACLNDRELPVNNRADSHSKWNDHECDHPAGQASVDDAFFRRWRRLRIRIRTFDFVTSVQAFGYPVAMDLRQNAAGTIVTTG